MRSWCRPRFLQPGRRYFLLIDREHCSLRWREEENTKKRRQNMRQRKLLTCGLLIFLVAAVQSTAWGQQTIGPFEITGFYQYTINPATEHANPNNFACLSFIVGPYNCSPGLQKKSGKPDFLLMRQFLDLNIYGKFSENWSVTLEPRFFHDMT